jgi:hypothetical protein
MMKRSHTSFTRRNVISLLLIGIAAVVVCSQFALVQNAAPQQAKRTFENKIPEHVPLKVKIKKDKEKKALDPNNKNWFRDIEIEVTNTSDKPIYFLAMHVIMRDVLNEQGVSMTFPLTYGRGDFYEQDTKPLPQDIPIEPKATHVFAFEENWTTGYEAWRNRNHKIDPLKLELWISHLSFGDGTGFTSLSAVPFPIKRDPADLAACFEKPRPPNQWSRTPNIFSALYAESFRRPADFLPVDFFSRSFDPNVFAGAAVSPDICCPGTACNKFKVTRYDCVCAINVQTVLTTSCSDPKGLCGTLVQLPSACSLGGVDCPSFGFIACPDLIPTPIPTPTPTPVPSPTPSCPATFPEFCPTRKPLDTCRRDYIGGCPSDGFYDVVGPCCVPEPCFYNPIFCPAGTTEVRLPQPLCVNFCVEVPNLPQATCLALGFVWSFSGGCRETAPTAQSDCDNFGWYWNPLNDYCQSDPPPACEIFFEVCENGGWSFEWCTCVPYNTPILIDVAGNGFSLTSSAAVVDYNLNNIGGKERLSWTAIDTDDAWLVLNRDRNRTIDDGTELFGDVSPQPEPPKGEKKNGFRALAEYDERANGGNADGQIDSRDAVFGSLRLWQDRNRNALSEPDELQLLPALNVATIDLDYKQSKKTDMYGNQFRYRAKVKNSQGQQSGRWAWDVYLVR